MSRIYEALIEAEKEGIPCALATVVGTIGCAPRGAGTKMLIYGDGKTEGTVGGGRTEQQVIGDALAAIRSGAPLLKVYAEDEDPQKADCVKSLSVFIEPQDFLPRLYLLGAGHVAQGVIPIAKAAGFHVTVLDTRDTSAYMDRLALADRVIRIESYADLSPVPIAPEGYFVLCTSSHKGDGEALASVLPLQPAYVGMLGAKHKFLPIFENMRKQGYTDEQLKEIYAPVGLDIGGQTPAEIGIGITAELMAVRYGRDGGSLREKRRASLFPD